MSYAIIRNEKHTKDKLIKLTAHNERKKKYYSNKNINVKNIKDNYHIRKPLENNYFKEFNKIKEKENLKGQIHNNSILACEFIITSHNEFFNAIGKEEIVIENFRIIF